MPADATMLRTDRELKLSLGGKRAFIAYGTEIVFKTQTGTKISRREIRRAIVLGRVDQYRVWIEPVLKNAVQSMGSLTHVDLWRDPEVAMELYRKVVD